jgi:hypothetical protein
MNPLLLNGHSLVNFDFLKTGWRNASRAISVDASSKILLRGFGLRKGRVGENAGGKHDKHAASETHNTRKQRNFPLVHWTTFVSFQL